MVARRSAAAAAGTGAAGAPGALPEPGLTALLAQVRACRLCADALPLGPRPVLQMGSRARILIAAQAPGRKVHETGRPFDDASGDRLRDWLGLEREVFYDRMRVAILPMGFCFPGTGVSGDLAPRRECAPAWRGRLLTHLKKLRLTIVIGRYALDYHLPGAKGAITHAVREWRSHGSDVIALPHPSGRNNIWLKRNRWFEEEVVPQVRERVAQALAT